MTPQSAITPAAANQLGRPGRPYASELQDGGALTLRIRGIEPEDLLGREPVQLDEAGIADLISGKTVLATGAGGSIGATGAGGSIGSELCRQVARYGPARIVLNELSESRCTRSSSNSANCTRICPWCGRWVT